MKMVKCDLCGTERPAERLYGNPLMGWFTLQPTLGETPNEEHLCSPACLISRGQQLFHAAEQEEERC